VTLPSTKVGGYAIQALKSDKFVQPEVCKEARIHAALVTKLLHSIASMLSGLADLGDTDRHTAEVACNLVICEARRPSKKLQGSV